MMEKPRVLICDDEDGVRESLKIILDEEYDLAYATNGEEAVKHVNAESPNLVILDIKMPKMNGLEALRQIKQVNPHLKILMVTGYESTDIASQAIKLGADDYLTKPFDGQKVLKQVRSLLGSRDA